MSHRRPLVLNDIKKLAQLALGDTVIAPPRRGAIAAVGDPADYTGEFYVATDEKNTYLSDGADWLLIGVGVPTPEFGAQNANEILAGPISGSPADPAFRAIDPLDLMAALAVALEQGTNVVITNNTDGTFTIEATSGVQVADKSADYTLVLADANTLIRHPSADTTARTFTIPDNGTVSLPIGTQVSFLNEDSAGIATIAITTDTMKWVGTAATGSRDLAPGGLAVATKVAATLWWLSGVGLS